MKLRLPRIAVVFLGLLVVATSLILVDNREGITSPASRSYKPSGTRALAELLTRQGFQVRSTRSVRERLAPDELAIAFTFSGSRPKLSSKAAEDDSPIRWMVDKHTERGGRVLLAYVPSQFRATTKRMRSATPITVRHVDDPRRTAKLRAEWSNDWLDDFSADWEFGPATWSLWVDDADETFVGVEGHGRGLVAHLRNGILATNRFLGEEDHAAWTVQLLADLAPSRKVVFLEAAHGDAFNPSLVQLIGPWAEGGWNQLTLMFVIAVIVLGARFGLPGGERFRQRGVRELVDAYAWVLARRGDASTAARHILESSDREVRRRLKIASDADVEVRNRSIPEPLVQAFAELERAIRLKAPNSVVMQAARRLDDEAAEFLGRTERRPARRRRN